MTTTYIPNLQDIVGYRALTATAIPKGWNCIGVFKGMAMVYMHKSGLRVLVSIAEMANGTQWTHASCIREDRLPSWEDLKAVKRWFIGNDRAAVQTLPKEADYVNVHPNCLHLWAPMEDKQEQAA